MKRILIIGDAHHQLIFNMVKWIRLVNPDIKVDIINTKYNTNKEIPEHYNEIYNYSISEKLNLTPFFGKAAHIRNIKKLIRQNPNTYDAVHFHFARTIYTSLIHELRKITDKIILTVWGSDFNAASSHTKKHLRKLFSRVDIISLSNESMMDNFLNYYNWSNDDEKFKIVRFGLEPLEYLKKNKTVKTCKEELGLPEDHIVISLGYNGSQNQQHLKIISTLNTNKDLQNWKNKLFFVVPVTYGASKEYLLELEMALAKFDFPYILYKKFLSEREIACLRLHTDIMIQLQQNDQFSGSMQEHLYAGGVVITGSWLPYSPLTKAGIYLKSIDRVEELGDELYNVLLNLKAEKERCMKNRELIYHLSSWKNNVEKWIELY